jgi:hypothetical protein
MSSRHETCLPQFVLGKDNGKDKYYSFTVHLKIIY